MTAQIKVAALYHFAPWPDFAAARTKLLDLCDAQGVRGSLLIAQEGVNGTIAGPPAGLEAALAGLRAITGFDPLQSCKFSHAPDYPFRRMKVRLKREIVTMGRADADPLKGVGRYVPPQEWNALISDPNTILVDTRNDYEVRLGAFAGARDPRTKHFREFPDYCERELADKKDQTIAMYCTGGIRCERATAFLKAQGYRDVVHLQGGILRYLEEIPESESLWRGACFVFDERVGLTHGLKIADVGMCQACGAPHEGRDAPCPHCGARAQGA
jgi:UPF0176 protein